MSPALTRRFVSSTKLKLCRFLASNPSSGTVYFLYLPITFKTVFLRTFADKSISAISDQSLQPIQKALYHLLFSTINIPDESGEKIQFNSFSNNSSARVRIHIKKQRWNVILLVPDLTTL